MATATTQKKAASKKRAPRQITAVKAAQLMADSVNPVAVNMAVQGAVIAGKLRMVAREGCYRQSNGNLQPFKKPVSIDKQVWQRLEVEGEVASVWSTGTAKLTVVSGSPAMDLLDICVGVAAFNKIMTRACLGSRPSMAGAPVAQHAKAIDYLIRYLRELEPEHFNSLKQATVQEMLKECYKKAGGRLPGARGLQDISVDIHALVRRPFVAKELPATLDKLARK